MQLVWLEINGFKRFSSLTKLSVDGKLVAIVGPNEGGKTTVLQACEHLNHANAVLAEGPLQETTRGSSLEPDHVIFEATYILDSEDKDSISHIPEASELRWFALQKNIGGGDFPVILKPRIKRDISTRTCTSQKLQESLSLFDGQTDNINIEELQRVLKSTDQTLEK